MIQQYMKLHFIYEEYIIRFYNVLCGELLIMHDYNACIYILSLLTFWSYLSIHPNM